MGFFHLCLPWCYGSLSRAARAPGETSLYVDIAGGVASLACGLGRADGTAGLPSPTFHSGHLAKSFGTLTGCRLLPGHHLVETSGCLGPPGLHIPRTWAALQTRGTLTPGLAGRGWGVIRAPHQAFEPGMGAGRPEPAVPESLPNPSTHLLEK